jgi:hypothetical protein
MGEIYETPTWRDVTRPAVLLRDAYACVICRHRDVTGDGLIVEHVDGLENLLAWGADPFDPGECHTVCLPCTRPRPPERHTYAFTSHPVAAFLRRFAARFRLGTAATP